MRKKDPDRLPVCCCKSAPRSSSQHKTRFSSLPALESGMAAADVLSTSYQRLYIRNIMYFGF